MSRLLKALDRAEDNGVITRSTSALVIATKLIVRDDLTEPGSVEIARQRLDDINEWRNGRLR